jgi:hypothetical protein
MNQLKAVLYGGPEDGLAIAIGGCQQPPRKFDIETLDGQMVRYVRDRRHGISGLPTYRFRGVIADEPAAN